MTSTYFQSLAQFLFCSRQKRSIPLTFHTKTPFFAKWLKMQKTCFTNRKKHCEKSSTHSLHFAFCGHFSVSVQSRLYSRTASIRTSNIPIADYLNHFQKKKLEQKCTVIRKIPHLYLYVSVTNALCMQIFHLNCFFLWFLFIQLIKNAHSTENKHFSFKVHLFFFFFFFQKKPKSPNF